MAADERGVPADPPDSTGADALADRFGSFVAGFDGSMVIVTVAAGGERAGCLVGFATPCSIEPPRFLAAISTANHTADVAARAATLAVHLVPPDRRDLAELFGEETGDEVDKFGRCGWEEGPTGVPVLAGCPAWFVGAVHDRVDLGDHLGYVLDPRVVSAGATGVRAGSTLRYGQVHDLDPGHPVG